MSNLHRIGARLKLQSATDLMDFQIHGNFVVWAGTPGPVAKQLHRLLERRYAAAIRRFSGASDAATLCGMWERSLEEGDVPGPYWAVLTHAVADPNLMIRADGQVHMLSHMVGASNRADIRRLVKLEAERDALGQAAANAKQRIAEQERAARTILVEHAAEVRELTTRLSAATGLSRRLKRAEERVRQLERNDAYRQACAEAQNASCALAQAHRDSDQQRRRIAHLADEVAGLEAALKSLATECEAAEWMLREHLAAVTASQPDTGDTEAAVFLCGRRIAYVGGRTGLIPHFRALVERSGGSLLHHDGGMEEQSSRLDGLLAQCDAVLCPIDCVSHDASMRAKRACKQRSMPFVCLRTSSLSSFAEGLRQLSQNSDIAIQVPE